MLLQHSLAKIKLNRCCHVGKSQCLATDNRVITQPRVIIVFNYKWLRMVIWSTIYCSTQTVSRKRNKTKIHSKSALYYIYCGMKLPFGIGSHVFELYSTLVNSLFLFKWNYVMIQSIWQSIFVMILLRAGMAW